MKKKLPIGISDFREIMEQNFYYVDKSLLIKELLDSGSKVVLLPRPRRFGKTLNLSMLRYFFEKTDEDAGHLFRDLAIWRQGTEYTDKQGQFPVIYLTFKDVKCEDWPQCFEKMKMAVAEQFKRHKAIMDSDRLDDHDKTVYRQVMEWTASKPVYENSLKQLSVWLEQVYGQKAIILIDEYDTPIQEGYLHGYYNEVISFVRNLLSGALKDNRSLQQGVLTGILRVGKESIFSGLNNLQVCTLLVPEFSTHFGLLETEVEQLLAYYDIGPESERVKDWYNGYVFGHSTLYNPWSIVNFAASPRNGLQPYWVNTSSNDLVRKVLTEGSGEIKQELEQLIRGETIRKAIDDNIVFRDIDGHPDALWSFLLFCGYLKMGSREQQDRLYVTLRIPNKEVETLFRSIIQYWFATGIHSESYRMMLSALVNGDTETFGDVFGEWVRNTFSLFDTGGDEPEKVYHAFVPGLLVSLSEQYEVKSNRESGYGRYDVMLIPRADPHRKGIVIEFKKTRRGESLAAAADAALRQIGEMRYVSELHERGIRSVVRLAIAFAGKEVLIKEGDGEEGAATWNT